MSEPDSAAIFARLPHRPPMLFLDAVEEVGPRHIVTRTTLPEGFLMADAEGVVSPLVAIELFAQASAAFFAARTADAAGATMQGALLGTRRLDVEVPSFHVGDVLRARVEESWGVDGLARFECELTRDGEVVAAGSINVAARLEPA